MVVAHILASKNFFKLMDVFLRPAFTAGMGSKGAVSSFVSIDGISSSSQSTRTETGISRRDFFSAAFRPRLT
jgi:hypothetical protein